MDTSHVYVGAWALGCFHSHISTRTFRRALTASLDSCAEIKIQCPVLRKVPESDARSVLRWGCMGTWEKEDVWAYVGTVARRLSVSV